jgi:hypothetical protein
MSGEEPKRSYYSSCHGHGQSRFLGPFTGLWEKIPDDIRLNIERNFLPEDPLERPIPGEKVLLEICMAWYRDLVSHLFFAYFFFILIVTLALSGILIVSATLSNFTPWVAVVPPIFMVAWAGLAVKERIEYMQRKLIKTNARLIISVPQPHAFPLADNLEIKGVPNVIDTNWSRNPLWRIFQAFTGARDVYLSLAGYQFVEGTARVRDALVMPDIMPEDVHQLKKLVFTIGVPPTRFLEPQEVIITDDRSGQNNV